MNKIQNILEKIIFVVLVVLSISMCLVVFWQVIARFIFSSPSRWSEEVARYFMIWIAFLGAAVGISKNSHLGMEIIVSRIKNPKITHSIKILIQVLCIVFCIYFIKYGMIYMLEGHRQTAMSFRMKMSYVYSIIPISGVIMIINFLEEMKTSIKKIRVGGEV